MEARFLFYLVWGMGVLVVYSLVLRQRRRQHTRHHDKRSRRDLLEAFALWLVSVAASLSVASVLYEPIRQTVPGLLTSVALGAFFAAGLIMLSEEPKERE